MEEAIRLIDLQNRFERECREEEEQRRFSEWMSEISDDLDNDE